MPNDNTQLATVSKRDLATMDFTQALEVYTPNFAAELPSHIPVERFKRTVVTAVNMNPDLRQADRRSLFNAAVKCAHDGLYPDNREAALVVFNTRAKNDHGQDVWIKAVQYMPMIQGIRKRMRNTGDVLSATAEVVYRNDKFRYVKGEDPHIEHEPPEIDKDRGEAVGAYAIIKLANGEVLREVMPKADIERARAVSRSGQKPDSPWVKWWDEMARKTVLRRCAKSAPTGSDLERLLARDDEPPTLPDASEMKVIPDRPRREEYSDPEPEVVTYSLVDRDGEFTDFTAPRIAAEAFGFMLTEAQTRSRDAVVAVWIDNEPLFTQLRADDDLAAKSVADAYEAARAATEPKKPASPEDRAEGAAGEALSPGSSDPPPASPAASPIAIVKPHGGKPDWPATRSRLVEAFYDLATIPDCDAFRLRHSATINALRQFAPDEFEIWDTLAATHERVRRGLHGEE